MPFFYSPNVSVTRLPIDEAGDESVDSSFPSTATSSVVAANAISLYTGKLLQYFTGDEPHNTSALDQSGQQRSLSRATGSSSSSRHVVGHSTTTTTTASAASSHPTATSSSSPTLPAAVPSPSASSSSSWWSRGSTTTPARDSSVAAAQGNQRDTETLSSSAVHRKTFLGIPLPSSAASKAKAKAEAEEEERRHTNAVNRSLSDIHTPTWVFLISLNSAVRATIFHPLQLALARKRVMQDERASVKSLMAAAVKGGERTLPGGKTSIDFGPGGLRSLYRGYGAAFLSSLAGEATYLLALEEIKQKVVERSEARRERKRKRLLEQQQLQAQQLLLEQVGVVTPDTSSGKKTSHGWSRLSETSASGTNAREQSRATPQEDYKGHHWASATGAMVADGITTLFVTPIAVVVGRQMTSGVGLAADNPYRSTSGTVKLLWGLHQSKAEEKLRQIALRRFPSATAGLTTPAEWHPYCQKIHPVQRGFWWTVYGLRGMYQGASAAMMRVPSSGVWWGTYTAAKEGLYSSCAPTLHRWNDAAQKKHDHDAAIWKQNWLLSASDNPLLNALASAIASTLTTILVNPVAVIQIRLQSLPASVIAESHEKAMEKRFAKQSGEAMPSSRGVGPRVYRQNSFIGVGVDVFRKEGIRGFFKGTTTNVGIAIFDGIVFAIMFELTKLGSDVGFMSKVKKDINDRRERREEAQNMKRLLKEQRQLKDE